MTQVLIIGFEKDFHAQGVQWALRCGGVECAIWGSGEFPATASSSIEIRETLSHFHYGETSFRDDPDTVWNRRNPLVYVGRDTLHSDLTFARQQSSIYLRSAIDGLNPRRWVNRPSHAAQAESKVLQLRAAAQVGFSTLPTLFSNDPAEIRAFSKKIGIIHKAFVPATWIDQDGGEHHTHTSHIDVEDYSDEVLALCPAIYQKYVRPLHEYRITIFGEYCFCLKIENPSDEVPDWRDWSTYEPSRKSLDHLDPELESRCRSLMGQLGLAFGTFDILVGGDSEPYFLEINQAGNFLFIEDHFPEVKALQRFCRFLAGPDNREESFPSLLAFRTEHEGVDWTHRIQNAQGELVRPFTSLE